MWKINLDIFNLIIITKFYFIKYLKNLYFLINYLLSIDISINFDEIQHHKFKQKKL